MSQCAVYVIDDDLSVAVARLLRSNGHRVCTYAFWHLFASIYRRSYQSKK